MLQFSYVIRPLFEWDKRKNRRNVRLHGIDFPTASLVFEDAHRIELYDERHSDAEDRYITIGRIVLFDRLVTVVYTIRDANTVRIISARVATGQEEREYYDRT